MRNMAVLHSPAFSYPLPVLVRVLFNLLIFKGKILYYNKYTHKTQTNKYLILLFILYRMIKSYGLRNSSFIQTKTECIMYVSLLKHVRRIFAAD